MPSRVVLAILVVVAQAALAVDAACVEVTIPPATIDSGTTFTPRIAVSNNGPQSLSDVPVSFHIVLDSDSADTIYYDTASSGPIDVGETVLVDFGSECRPATGNFIMTGVAELPGDVNRHNDTCSSPLFVRYTDVAVEITSPRDTEQPGLIPFVVRLTNLGNVPALVHRLDMVGWPRGYGDYRENIAIPVGGSQTVSTIPVYYYGGTETCMAWITKDDVNPHNDTDIVIVRTASWLDVAVKTVSPRDSEAYGLVPVKVRLTNVGGEPALVPSLGVSVPPDYADLRLNVPVGVGKDTLVTLKPWICPPSGTELFTAWIDYPADTNHTNDTDVVIVHAAGVLDRAEMGPHNGTSLALSPSPLVGNVLRVEYGLNQAGPAGVTVFDVTGQAIIRRGLRENSEGELRLDLHTLKGGVYIVRLEDGRSAIVRKLVVQR